jgi:outer membrane usher protein
MFVNYNFGEINSNYNSSGYSYKWASLMPGFNFGAWRFRNSSYVEKSTFTATHWRNQNSYLERGFYNNKSRLTIGKKITSGAIFDSLPFTGVMFGTDENMFPSSARQYSPMVRGIARTSARVEVQQNGYTVYNANVPPGPFELNDINQIRSGGNLDVIVWESDGTKQNFSVPYQIPAIALHPGYLNYNFVAGHYSSAYARNSTSLSQITLMYGFPADFSGYGGLQYAKNYQSFSIGIGKSLGMFGGVSLDSTHSSATKKDSKTQGQMWRLRYTN